MSRSFVVLAAMLLVSMAGGRAAAWDLASDDHARPELSAAEETAWLHALIEASPHRQAMTAAPAHAGEAPGPLATVDAAYHQKLGALQAQAKKPGRVVFGYLPYWTKKTAVIPWPTLTTLAWFSVGLSTGGVSNSSGWNTSESKALIATAHSKGVQVVLCFTQFGTAAISAILATPASRTKAVNDIAAAVLAGGGDGANIDFEGLAKADRDKMSAFIDELNTTLKQKLPGADVTMATPCVDWSGAWNYQYLAEHSDGLFVMAYAIHWGGGAPGPQLPMAAKAPWTHKTLQWVVDDYVYYGKAKNKAKFILGLPLYGYSWPSATDKPGSKATAKGTSVTYGKAQDAAGAAGGWVWDSTSESTFFVTKDAAGGWVQTWCDNFKALAMRVDYLHASDVMLGLWALGYSDGDPPVLAYIDAWKASKPGAGVADGADAGPIDAGSADAGSTDTGAKDTSGDAGGDSGTKDAATDAAADTAVDTAPADVAKPDAPDSAGPDTAGVDAAASGDGAAVDAGPGADAAADDAAGPDLDPTAPDSARRSVDAGRAGRADGDRSRSGSPDAAPRLGEPDGTFTGGNGAGAPEDGGATLGSSLARGVDGGCAARGRTDDRSGAWAGLLAAVAAVAWGWRRRRQAA
ncbi:MAG: hypothetical protein FJ100_02975 [Deltaproteobacteria bacterium]|nr:hypothetical protein [Deltaproteobacteria bacterium]